MRTNRRVGALVAMMVGGACSPEEATIEPTMDAGFGDVGFRDAGNDLGMDARDVGVDRGGSMDAPSDRGREGDGASAEVFTPECRATLDCTGGRLCRMGRCVEPATTCSATAGCADDARCATIGFDARCVEDGALGGRCRLTGGVAPCAAGLTCSFAAGRICVAP